MEYRILFDTRYIPEKIIGIVKCNNVQRDFYGKNSLGNNPNLIKGKITDMSISSFSIYSIYNEYPQSIKNFIKEKGIK